MSTDTRDGTLACCSFTRVLHRRVTDLETSRRWRHRWFVGVPVPRLTAAVMEIDGADASRILGQLEAAGLVVWLDGGWGVDAVLGQQTRLHHDLDLVIARDDLAAAQQALAPAGFAHDATAVPGLPARLVLVDAHGRQVDLHPVIFDRHGCGWQELGGDAWGAYPAEELTSTGVIAGRSVRDFRHTFATWLEDAGIPARVIDELMGHEASTRGAQHLGGC
jgi:lincosamide nucleotidyltransferase A/C/D/E